MLSSGNGTRSALMLLDNEYGPDLRVEREAMTLVSQGWEIQIICWDREGRLPEYDHPHRGITVRRIRTPAQRQLGIRQAPNLCRYYTLVWGAKEHLIPLDTCVIHAHDILMLPLAVALKRWLGPKIRLIYDAHEIYVKMEAHRYPASFLNFVDRAECLLINQYANAFITVSHQRVRDWWASRVSKPPIFICGNWYDARSIDPQERHNVRVTLDIPDDAFVIGYLGSLNSNRRLDLLLEAVAGQPDFLALLGGRGGELSTLMRRIDAMPNASFLGWVDDPWPVYSACDALYYLMDPTHPYAHFNAPNNANIALALGLPLITGPEGESAEIVRHTGRGRIVIPEAHAIRTALRELSAERTLSHPTSHPAPVAFPDWTWKHAARALLEAYEAD